MNVDKILDGLAKLSPVVGAAVGGPVGGLIGKGVAVAASMITGKSEPEDIVKELTMNPDKLAELEIKTRELELEELRIHAADRASAREMQAKLAAAGHGSAWAAPIVSVVVAVGFFLMLWVVLDKTEPQIPQVALVMLGALATGFTQMLNYWLGSSRGSSDKTRMLAGLETK